MAIGFQPFDTRKPLRLYRRNLPHWRQDGATYFVTFRLDDALPQHLVAQLAQLRVSLRAGHDEQEDSQAADREYFRSMKRYLDQGHGACWFRRPALRDLVVKALRKSDGERYELGEHTVMPNHVHVLVRPLPGCELEGILHGWKGWTGRALNLTLRRRGRVWQDESYDRLVRDSTEFVLTARYIRNNGNVKAEPGC